MKINKLLTISILVVLLIINAACQKNLLKRSPLEGTWIESEKKTDTILFLSEYDGQYPVLT